MTNSRIDSQLQEILTDLGIRPTALTNEAHFIRDLGFDSLDVTDLLLQVETHFGIRIPDEDWSRLQTFGQLKEYLSTEMVFES